MEKMVIKYHFLSYLAIGFYFLSFLGDMFVFFFFFSFFEGVVAGQPEIGYFHHFHMCYHYHQF